MWSLKRDARRCGLLLLCVLAMLAFQAPAFAWNTPPPRGMEGIGVGFGTGIGETPPFAQFDTTVAHQFRLLCDVITPTELPNRLVANWNDVFGNSYTFTLKSLSSSTCSYQTMPSIFCRPIVLDCFDTIIGTGIGSLVSRYPSGAINLHLPHCLSCGQIDFRFTDNGLPKTGNALQIQPFDIGEFTVSDLNFGSAILFACMDCPPAQADYRARQRGTLF